MVLRGEEVQVEARFGLFLVLTLMQDRCTVCVDCTICLEINGAHPMELLMTCVIWNLASVYLETVLVSVQDRCIVCA